MSAVKPEFTFSEAFHGLAAIRDYAGLQQHHGQPPNAVLEAFYQALREATTEAGVGLPEEFDRAAAEIHIMNLFKNDA